MAVPIIKHNDYNKITERLVWLTPTCYLNINARLTRRYNDGNINYYSENKYYSEYYKSEVINIELQPSFFYSIDDNKNGIHMVIYPHKIAEMQACLNLVYSWFTSSKYGYNLYKESSEKGMFELNQTLSKNLTITIKDLPNGGWISFIPIIVLIDNISNKPGVRLYLGNDRTFVDIDLNAINELILAFNTNIYLLGNSIISMHQQPSYGTNLILR